MNRCVVFLALMGFAGCATTKAAAPASSPAVYSADVTYTLSATTLAELAETGQDYKLALSLQAGSDGTQPRSCTVTPAAPAGKPLAQRLLLTR